MKHFILSLFGRDRPGIVAGVSGVLYRLGLNIEDSSMTRLNGEFTIMLILSSQEDMTSDALFEALQSVAQAYELFVVCKEIPYEEYTQPREGLSLYRIVVFGSDKPGIVYRVSKLLADYGVNISDLRTEKRQDLYVMLIECESEKDLYGELMAGLAELKDRLGVDIHLEREEVAEL